MTIRTTKVEAHWNYFLAIERDVEVLSRYVEFDSRNFDCFSIEIARVLLSASAEVDVACKQLCRAAGVESGDINSHRTTILKLVPEIAYFDIGIPRFGMELTPWYEWHDANGVPV